MSLVSVVIPSHNDRDNLVECLDSVFSQSFTDFEVIVVDDNSSDGTKDAVEQKYGGRVTVIHNKSNIGPAASRNLGLENAGGEYIAFIDSDCIASRRWLEGAVSILEKNAEIACVGGPIINPNKSVLSKTNHLLEFREYSHKKSRKVRMLPTANAVYKKDILREVGLFNEKLRRTEDVDLSWRVKKTGRGLIYSPTVMVYHKTKGGWSSITRKQFLMGRWFYVVRRMHPDIPLNLPKNKLLLLALTPLYYIASSIRSLFPLPDKRMLLQLPLIIPLVFFFRLFFWAGVISQCFSKKAPN